MRSQTENRLSYCQGSGIGIKSTTFLLVRNTQLKHNETGCLSTPQTLTLHSEKSLVNHLY